MAIRRAQGRLGHAAKVMAAGTSAEAAGAALGGIYWGMTGLCIGWAIAASCEAVVLLPAVIRVFHRDPPAEPDPGPPPPPPPPPPRPVQAEDPR